MIHKSVRLHCGLHQAFALFTERVSEWWPESRRHTKDPKSQLFMLASGRFWERASDGHEVELGRVRSWEPPRRLVLDFYPGTDPQHPTEVVVTFQPEGDGTRVSVLHQPTPVSAELWKQRATAFERSWEAVLGAFVAAAESLDHR